MGIVEGSCKYRARGVSIRGNEPRRRVPGAPSSDTPRESQANFRGSCWYRARGISIRGKFVLSRNLGYKTRGGGRYVAKSSSDPRRVYPDVKLQGRDIVRVVGIVVHFAPLGFGTHGKFVLSSPSGKMGLGDVCRVPLAAERHGKARQTLESGPCGDCRRVLWVLVFGENSFYREKLGTIRGDRHVAERSSDPR